MTLFFPDLNVGIALSVTGHTHSERAWNWLRLVPPGAQLAFSRYTHLGLLRLLTNQAAMAENTMNLREAWAVYDRWLRDMRVKFSAEPENLETALRNLTAPFGSRPASKWVGDCYLLAYAGELNATLVTFDRALAEFAHKQGYSAIIPA